MKKQLEWILFTVLAAVVLVSFFFQHRVLNLTMLVSSFLYLGLGWKLFNPDKESKFDPVYFFLGYSISTAFIAFFLVYSVYPMAEMVLYGAIFFLLVSLILFLVLKKENRTEPIVRIVVFLLLTVLAMIH